METYRFKQHLTKTMAWYHTLNQVKAVLGMQQMFGSRRLHYDADFHRENGTWDADNLDELGAGGRNQDDALWVRQDEAPGRIVFNMESGKFIQNFDDPKRENLRANIDGFERFDAWEARNSSFTITGTGKNNSISTSDGSDFIDGAKGNDAISAGKGNDIIMGGSGVDSIRTGDGRDTIITKEDFGFALIKDFEIGQDRLLVQGGMRNVTIKDFRDVDFDSYREEMLAGIRGPYGVSENSLLNSSMVFKGNDLVAVIESTEASDLSIVGQQIM